MITFIIFELSKFFETQAVGSAIEMPLYNMGLIDQLQVIAQENPSGFTVSLPNLQFITRGWVVAKKETQNSFGLEGLNRALEVALKTSKTIGGWQDEELFYWDAVMVFNNEDEATQAGIENEQLAIYNIETNYLKWL